MLSDAWIIAKKEIRLLFKSTRRIMLLFMTPAIILFVILILMFFIGTSIPPLEEGPVEVIMIQDDAGYGGYNWGENFYRMLKDQNGTKELNYINKSVNELDSLQDAENLTVLLYIPANFSEMISRSNITLYPEPALFQIYYNAENAAISGAVTNITVLSYQLNLMLVYNDYGPVKLTRVVAVHEGTTGEQLSSFLVSYLTMIPLYAILLFVVPPLTLVLISVTIEREQKTLESLLLQPLERKNIVAGKLLYGMILVAINVVSLVMTFIVIIAVFVMLLPGDMRGQLVEIIITLLENTDASVWLFLGYIIVGLILVSILIVAAAVLFSMLAKDEREANMVVSSIIIIPLIGVMFIGFLPLDKLPEIVQLVLLILPLLGFMFGIYTAMLSGELTIAWLTLVFQVIWIVVEIWFAGRLIESEGILEISFKRLLRFRGRR
ncbi:MAG: ABC transporter permease [Candidatus Hodarchaeales archaeon]|jgi:ABC-type Na+ efflux pump permease subunit